MVTGRILIMTGKESTKGGRGTYVFGATSWNCCYRLAVVADEQCQVTADMLPDVVLLIFFDCYVIQAEDGARWYTVHEYAENGGSVVFGPPVIA